MFFEVLEHPNGKKSLNLRTIDNSGNNKLHTAGNSQSDNDIQSVFIQQFYE